MGCIQVTDLNPLKGMPLMCLELAGGGPTSKLENIRPLRGINLERLGLSQTSVRDLTPLEGMPLQHLRLGGKVTDVTPLRGMELRSIQFHPKNIREGMNVLREMKSIVSIGLQLNMMAPEEFWRRYDAGEFK